MARIHESVPHYAADGSGIYYTSGARAIHCDGRKPLRRPADAAAIARGMVREDAPYESMAVAYLDGRHRIIAWAEISRGTLDASLVHPREVFAEAVQRRAAAIVLAHNHPSGDPTPSQADRDITERLVKAGQLLGIHVLDHIVIGARGFSSLNELGAIRQPQTLVALPMYPS